jgi:diaminohydroxyphosphoribosylaminopyrimidine deaminase/5-amino-6-(5-phosphoribosylamino)uracil reductase
MVFIIYLRHEIYQYNMETDEVYMSRCIELARHGAGLVHPNPMVGAVIVHNGEVVGEGYHRYFGGAHAEVNAINEVMDKQLLKGATLYVNLEPCAHFGKTPPCAELVARMGIPRVVMACVDPNPKVAGRGIDILRSNGVEVVTGIMQAEAEALNREFITYHKRRRPYVYLKWAKSIDGYIDRNRISAELPPVIFSSPGGMQAVHKKRSEVAAIMVGTRTAILDNPRLNVRTWPGKSPVRIALDRHLQIPAHYHILDGSAPALIFTEEEKENCNNVEYIRIDFQAGVLQQVMSILYRRGLISLMVEGGAALLNSFIAEGLWDEWQEETAPVYLHDGVQAPILTYPNVKQL